MTFVRFSSVSASFCNCFYLNFINSQIFCVVIILTGMFILDFKVIEDLLMFSIYSGSGIYCLIEALARLLILLISYLTKGVTAKYFLVFRISFRTLFSFVCVIIL